MKNASKGSKWEGNSTDPVRSSSMQGGNLGTSRAGWLLKMEPSKHTGR